MPQYALSVRVPDGRLTTTWRETIHTHALCGKGAWWTVLHWGSLEECIDVRERLKDQRSCRNVTAWTILDVHAEPVRRGRLGIKGLPYMGARR